MRPAASDLGIINLMQAKPTQHGPLDELRRRHQNAEEGGGPQRRARQHAEGKLSARERIELLLDEGTFEELDKLVRHRCRDFGMDEQVIDGDGFVTGYGLIDGRAGVRLRAGLHGLRRLALGDQRAEDLQDHGPGDEDRRAGDRPERFRRRAHPGGRAVAGGYADIFLRNTLASGVVPQISAIMGPCAGGAVYSPAITDFIFMVDQHQLHVRHRART